MVRKSKRVRPEITNEMVSRFWEKVAITSGCWYWRAGLNQDGYGLFTMKHGYTERAHRFMYTLWFGEIPPKKIVLHSCDNPSCVRPSHLSIGTPRDNTHDAVKKGRMEAKIAHQPEVLASIFSAYESGISIREIARNNGVSHWTIRYHLKKAGVHRDAA